MLWVTEKKPPVLQKKKKQIITPPHERVNGKHLIPSWWRRSLRWVGLGWGNLSWSDMGASTKLDLVCRELRSKEDVRKCAELLRQNGVVRLKGSRRELRALLFCAFTMLGYTPQSHGSLSNMIGECSREEKTELVEMILRLGELIAGKDEERYRRFLGLVHRLKKGMACCLIPIMGFDPNCTRVILQELLKHRGEVPAERVYFEALCKPFLRALPKPRHIDQVLVNRLVRWLVASLPKSVLSAEDLGAVDGLWALFSHSARLRRSVAKYSSFGRGYYRDYPIRWPSLGYVGEQIALDYPGMAGAHLLGRLIVKCAIHYPVSSRQLASRLVDSVCSADNYDLKQQAAHIVFEEIELDVDLDEAVLLHAHDHEWLLGLLIHDMLSERLHPEDGLPEASATRERIHKIFGSFLDGGKSAVTELMRKASI